jgi:threonine dehydratase
VRHCNEIDRAVGARVLLKDESGGPIGSFKGRGTAFFVARAVRPSGELVCASAGNFGQGLAYSGTARDHKVTVFAATTANPLKIEKMRKLGAEVRLAGADFDGANEAAKAYAKDTLGARYVEDCDIPEIAEGAGTMARELTEEGAEFNAMFVPVGGGALANGIGCWLRHARPGCRVIGVNAKGAPALHDSWHARRIISTEKVDTIADGIAIRAPVAYALEQLERNLDDFVLVSDEQMIAAMRLANSALGLAIEPSAAAVIAAMLQMRGKLPGAVAAPISGSNLTEERRAAWLS